MQIIAKYLLDIFKKNLNHYYENQSKQKPKMKYNVSNERKDL